MTREELIDALVEAVSRRSREKIRTDLGMSNSRVQGLYDMDRFITHKLATGSKHDRALTNVLSSTQSTRDARYRRYKVTKRIPGVS